MYILSDGKMQVLAFGVLLAVLLLTSAQDALFPNRYCYNDDDAVCGNLPVNCCGGSEHDNPTCHLPPLDRDLTTNPWKVCDFGTVEMRWRKESTYVDELVNTGDSRKKDWRKEGVKNADKFDGPFGWTNRHFTLVSMTNNEFFIRGLIKDEQNWPPGYVVWIFVGFGRAPQVAYTVQEINGMRRITISNDTVADYTLSLGTSTSVGWVMDKVEGERDLEAYGNVTRNTTQSPVGFNSSDNFTFPPDGNPLPDFNFTFSPERDQDSNIDDQTSSPFILPSSTTISNDQILIDFEDLTVLGKVPNGNPEDSYELWIAILVGGETPIDNQMQEAHFELSIEVHDNYAEFIYIAGFVLLMAFCVIMLVIIKKFPKTWQKIIGFFWDRGAPPEPESEDEALDEDSCDEGDFLEKTEAELELEMAQKELEAKENEARKIRQQEIARGSRGSIEHSDEDGADEWAEEMQEGDWSPADLIDKIKHVMGSAKAFATYPGKDGMNQDSLFEHATVLSEQVQLLMEIRGKPEAAVKKTPSRKTRNIAEENVTLNPEVEAARKKAKELEEKVGAQLEEKKQMLKSMGKDLLGKIPINLQFKAPKLPFLKGRRESVEDADEEKLILGAVVEVPFEQCVKDLRSEVLPKFEAVISDLVDLPSNEQIAHVNVGSLVGKMRSHAGEIEKSILKYVPTFCSSLERELKMIKEERAKLDLLDSFDEKHMKPLNDFATIISDARNSQTKIMKCIKQIQRISRIKSVKYYKAKGRKLLDDEDTGDVEETSAISAVAAVAGVTSSEAPKAPEPPPEPEADSETLRELREAEEAFAKEQQRVASEEKEIQANIDSEAAKEKETVDAMAREEAEKEAENERLNNVSEDDILLEMENKMKADQEEADSQLKDANSEYEKENATATASHEESSKELSAAEAEASAMETEAAETAEAQRRFQEESAAREKAIDEESAEALKKAEAEEAEPKKSGGLMGGLNALKDKAKEGLNKAKEAAKEKQELAKKKLDEEKAAFEAKHAEKFAALEEKKKELREKAEAKKREIEEKHADKIRAIEEKKNAAIKAAEEKKQKAMEEFEKAKAAGKELARRAREDREALLAEIKAEAVAKKNALASAAKERVAEADRKRKELAEALKDRDKLIANLKARAAAELEKAKQQVSELKDKATNLIDQAKAKLTGGANVDTAKKDLEVFIFNLKKVSLSSIRPAIAGAMADVQGLIKEAHANEALFVEEDAAVDDIQDDLEDATENFNIGAMQGILKEILKKLKSMIGVGSGDSEPPNEDVEFVIEELKNVKESMTTLSTDLKDKVVNGVTQLRNCLDGDIPELGSLVGSIGSLKDMIIRGHTLGKVIGNAYTQMDGVINFEAAVDYKDAIMDLKHKAATEIREFTKEDPPEVRDAAFVFKCNERQMHWEKEISRAGLLFSMAITRNMEEGNAFNSKGEKKRKKTIWDRCMPGQGKIEISGPKELTKSVLKAPDQVPNFAADMLKLVEEMSEEFQDLLQIAWKDVCKNAEELSELDESKLSSDKGKEAKKQFLHAGQRVESALYTSHYLIGIVLNSFESAGFPVDNDKRVHIFEVSRSVTRELKKQVASSLGIVCNVY